MPNKFLSTAAIFGILLFLSCSTNTSITSISDSKSEIDKKVDSVMQLMTLDEKIGQLNQYNGFYDITGPTPKQGTAAKKYEDLKNGLVGSMLNVKGAAQVRTIQKIAVEQSRLHIPLLFGFDVIHGHKTITPIPLGESASWDLEAIKKSAEMAALEASAEGLNWTFAPMVDVARDARWGRVMEGAGEDPFLGSKIAVARINGFQGMDLSKKNTILACAKHFAGYAFAESGRDYNTVDISEETLQNIVFPPFKASVDAGVRTFMNSFNELNGIPATGNKYLQREILKKDWGFKGFVVSDWGSIAEMIPHGYATDLKNASEIAINAGSDMDMESYGYVDNLKLLVNEGKVKVSLIDDAARRILKTKFELGLFKNPYLYCDEQYEKEIVGSKIIQDAALDMAKKSIVLLKNEKQLLPLSKQGNKIAVIGALAADKTSPLGSWRIAAEDETAVSLLEGLKNYTGNTITYTKGADVAIGRTQFVWETKINTTDKSGFEEAITNAKNADIVVLMLGEHGLQSGEGRSRSEIDLPGVQQELLEEIYKVNTNIVLVLTNGRPLTIPWAAENIPSILETWHLGTQSGNAIAQVLFGDYNPSGKLPMSFPRNVGQVPIYYNHKNTGRPSSNEPESVFWSHYGDVYNTPQFAFGHGLSYSKFTYSDIYLDKSNFAKNGQISATIEVTNQSKVEGKEVVQMYIRDLVGSLTRPVLELKGFEMINLKPNETKKISFTINEKTIEYFTANKKWEAEPGDFKLFIGGSSDKTKETNFKYSN
jgi:beta-glucosidase